MLYKIMLHFALKRVNIKWVPIAFNQIWNAQNLTYTTVGSEIGRSRKINTPAGVCIEKKFSDIVFVAGYLKSTTIGQ